MESDFTKHLERKKLISKGMNQIPVEKIIQKKKEHL
jgi:hypothetical protein